MNDDFVKQRVVCEYTMRNKVIELLRAVVVHSSLIHIPNLNNTGGKII